MRGTLLREMDRGCVRAYAEFERVRQSSQTTLHARAVEALAECAVASAH